MTWLLGSAGEPVSATQYEIEAMAVLVPEASKSGLPCQSELASKRRGERTGGRDDGTTGVVADMHHRRKVKGERREREKEPEPEFLNFPSFELADPAWTRDQQ